MKRIIKKFMDFFSSPGTTRLEFKQGYFVVDNKTDTIIDLNINMDGYDGTNSKTKFEIKTSSTKLWNVTRTTKTFKDRKDKFANQETSE